MVWGIEYGLNFTANRPGKSKIVSDIKEYRLGGSRLYPPTHVLVQMMHTKADALEEGVLQITPLTKTFSIVTVSGNNIAVSRQQLPGTQAGICVHRLSIASANNPSLHHRSRHATNREIDVFQCIRTSLIVESRGRQHPASARF